MEIIRLEFQGIGPFVDHNVIDFRELGRGGLFLLEGPTGSGKTTILDAIVFALYGDVSGEDSSKQRIVSTLLRPDREPFVDLVVDSSRGLLRVRRTPEFERLKLRGQGTTTNKATIKLWKLASPDDVEGIPISTSVAEADDELRQAIGLTKAQFTQTVMLPQGDFATFLRAKPEDRRDVLQDIFGTEFYDRFATKLSDMARQHRSATESARDRFYDVASSYCIVAWDDDAKAASEKIPEQVAFDAARDATDLAAVREGVRARASALDAQLAEALAVAEAARATHREMADRLSEKQTHNRLIVEVDALRARREELAEREPAFQIDEARLAAADRAEHARRPLHQREDAATALRHAEEAMTAEVQRVTGGADADLVTDPLTARTLQAHEGSARMSAGLLDRLVLMEKGFTGRQSELTRDGDAQKEEESRISAGLDDVAKLRDEVDELSAQATARQAVADTLAGAVERHAAAKEIKNAAGEAVNLSSQLVQAKADASECALQLQRCSTAYKAAHDTWVSTQAAELSSSLVDGEPCVVCGSQDHPARATPPDGTISADELDALAEAVEVARSHADEARSKSEKFIALLEHQVERCGGVSPAAAEAEYAAAASGLKAARQATKEAAHLREHIDSTTRAIQDRVTVLSDAQATLAARRGALSQFEKHLQADRAEVDAEAGGYASVGLRRDALRSRADDAHRLAVLLQAVATAGAESARCDAELATVLAERGFPSDAAASASMLPGAERTRLKASVDDYRSGVATVDAQLLSERYAGLVPGSVAEDLTELERRAEEADAAQREAERRCGMIDQTVRSAAQASRDLASKITLLETLREEAGPLIRMSNLASGGEGNLQRVTLPAYVLLRRFEEVVDVANVRLDAMTGGRYELRRTDEKEGRSQRLGLGLEVIDHQARDTTRAPRTLSGGETFMASLALALGLADSVTAEAGGIQLHTLFVDEGFGSLDPDTLDAVMQQLTSLRAGGRAVGVVSHVTEMKQRIAERISVVPRHDGTSTLTCSASVSVALG